MNSIYISRDITRENEPIVEVEVCGEYAIQWFKILIERAMNNWDNAPWELKQFADQFIDGTQKGKQDYEHQAQQTIQKPPTKLHN